MPPPQRSDRLPPTFRPPLGPICRPSSQTSTKPSSTGVDAALPLDELIQRLGIQLVLVSVRQQSRPLASCPLARGGSRMPVARPVRPQYSTAGAAPLKPDPALARTPQLARMRCGRNFGKWSAFSVRGELPSNSKEIGNHELSFTDFLPSLFSSPSAFRVQKSGGATRWGISHNGKASNISNRRRPLRSCFHRFWNE